MSCIAFGCKELQDTFPFVQNTTWKARSETASQALYMGWVLGLVLAWLETKSWNTFEPRLPVDIVLSLLLFKLSYFQQNYFNIL